MSNAQLMAQIALLPETLKQEVAEFIESLQKRTLIKTEIKERQIGIAKGLIEMSDDFDAPLAEFKEYM